MPLSRFICKLGARVTTGAFLVMVAQEPNDLAMDHGQHIILNREDRYPKTLHL